MLVRKTIKQEIFDWLVGRPERIIAFSFLLVILVGTVLLSLPFAVVDGVDFTIFDALFTAVSATCVIGLTVVDTATAFTVFGKIVIILLVQVGALGLITITSFALSVMKKVTFKTRRIALESAGAFTFTETQTLLKSIVFITISFELIGTLLFSFVLVPEYGLVDGIGRALFHSISSFCNAGFDIMRDSTLGTNVSLVGFKTNPYFLIATAVLVVFGGLGFVVWVDLVNYKQKRRLFLHTKVTIQFSLLLLLLGTLLVMAFEWNNVNTIGQECFGTIDKIINSFMQSATYRTAGFYTFSPDLLTESSKAVAIVLMFIGSGSGSTGGGIKVTTFAILVYTVLSEIKGETETVMHKNIVSNNIVRRALAIFAIGIGTILLFSVALSFIEYEQILSGTFTYTDILFDVTSAFTTVGLSLIGVSNLSFISRVLMLFAMFLGRVGPIALLISFAMREEKGSTKIYPEGQIHIG